MDNNNNNKNNNNTEKKSFAKAFAEGWARMPAGMKTLTLTGMIISAAVIILAILSIFNVWENAGIVYMPLLGVLMLVQGAENWNVRRKLAYFSIAAAVFILICWGAVIFMKF